MQQIRVATFDGPEAPPVIRTVLRLRVPAKAALFTVGACGVCGTDLHILAGHWPKPLPWPFTLGHEVAGLTDEIGSELTEDYMGNPLEVGAKIMIPPLMPCGSCCYPNTANKCLPPVYYGRYLGFEGAAPLGRLGRDGIFPRIVCYLCARITRQICRWASRADCNSSRDELYGVESRKT